MGTVLAVAAIWTVASIPAAVILGRYLRRMDRGHTDREGCNGHGDF